MFVLRHLWSLAFVLTAWAVLLAGHEDLRNRLWRVVGRAWRPLARFWGQQPRTLPGGHILSPPGGQSFALGPIQRASAARVLGDRILPPPDRVTPFLWRPQRSPHSLRSRPNVVSLWTPRIPPPGGQIPRLPPPRPGSSTPIPHRADHTRAVTLETAGISPYPRSAGPPVAASQPQLIP